MWKELKCLGEVGPSSKACEDQPRSGSMVEDVAVVVGRVEQMQDVDDDDDVEEEEEFLEDQQFPFQEQRLCWRLG